MTTRFSDDEYEYEDNYDDDYDGDDDDVIPDPESPSGSPASVLERVSNVVGPSNANSGHSSDYIWEVPALPEVQAFFDQQPQLVGIVSIISVDPTSLGNIWGTAKPDTITGTDGKDWLGAGPGEDIVRGRSGDDVVLGGRGDDVVNGQAGDDLLFGGQGADVFVLGAGCDVIADYALEDSIRLGTVSDLSGVQTADGALLRYDTAYGNGAGSTLVIGADLNDLVFV